MNTELFAFSLAHIKLVALSALSGSLFLAEAAASTNTIDVTGWESLGLKSALILAIIWLVRESSRERADHKAQAAEREQRLLTAMERNSTALDAITDETRRQTQYFDGVSADLIKMALKQPPPQS